jgi:DNA repair protein RecO (recombination protein O)
MISTPALVLHTYPILEKDMVVELFTKDVGRIRAFVKYAQSKKPRFGGLLNTMNYVLVELIKKKDTYYIRQIRLETEFVNLKKSYKKMALGYHFIRLIQSLTQYNQENDGLFNVMIQSFKELDLDSISDLSALKKYVYHKILELEGIMPKHKVTLSEKDYVNLIQEYTHQIVKERL